MLRFIVAAHQQGESISRNGNPTNGTHSALQPRGLHVLIHENGAASHDQNRMMKRPVASALSIPLRFTFFTVLPHDETIPQKPAF